MKKRILQIAIILVALWGAAFLAKRADEYRALRAEKFGVEQKPVILPTDEIAEKLSSREIVNYMDVSAGFESVYDEWTYPAALLEELQEYVATDSVDLLLTDYADISAKITTEDFLSKCPDYAQVLREWFVAENLRTVCESFDVTGTRFSVYEMQLEGQSVWMIKYIGHSCVDYPILFGQKDGATYVIDAWYWFDENFTVIPYEQDGEKKYYVIMVMRDWNGDSYAASLMHPQVIDYYEDGEIDYIPVERVYIYNSPETVEPQYAYINNKEKLAHQVMDYVDENLWMLAGMNRNNVRIWGDEEIPDSLSDVEQKRIREAIGERKYYEYEYALADYNNDGEKELFYRTSDKPNIYLEKQPDGTYKRYYCRLRVNGRGLVVEKVWFVEFEDKVVTFEIAERLGKKDGKFLLAYIHENGKETPLVVCRICHDRMITVSEHVISASTVGFNDKVPLLETGVPSEAEQRRAADRRSMISLKQIERVVSLWDGQLPFPEELFGIVRETFRELAQGDYSEYSTWEVLEPYMVDIENDTIAFGKYADELTEWNSYEVPFENRYIWGYKWFEDGDTINYLVCDYTYDYSGPVRLDWYQGSEGKFRCVETIAESDEYGEFRLIAYEGKLYCINSLRQNPERASLCGMQVVCIGENGDWETYVYKLEEDYECIPVYQYGETQDLFQDYVTDNYAEMITAMQHEEWYGANRGAEGLAKDEIRMLKNILGPNFAEDGYQWMLADIDNDAAKEYIICDDIFYGNFFFSIYRNANGEFREVDVLGTTIYDELVSDGAQFWVEERDGLNYVFVLEKSGVAVRDYVLHIRLVEDGVLTEKAAYLFRATPREVVCSD